MNRLLQSDGFDPFQDTLDAILASIAVNIQLPPGLHAQATERYEAVRRYIEREGSPLHNRINRFYPQGSMAIDATISIRGTDDEYDLDIVAETNDASFTEPDRVMDLFEQALEDYPVSQMIERQTRCVTIRYADRMHLDITPSLRQLLGPDRQSHIVHAKKEEPPALHYLVPMNAWAFARWYETRTPIERTFADAFNRRLFETYGYDIRADAEVDNVPDQVPLIVKNTATVALQLLKRFRNVTYADYQGRIPPSVMMSFFAGQVARPGIRLADMVILQARAIAMAIRHASAHGEKLRVTNPMYEHDDFTDRWPKSIAQQDEFAARLTMLAKGLEAIRRGNFDLESVQDWLREQFGERVVSRSFRQFNERTGRAVQQGGQSYTYRVGIYVPSAPAIIGISSPAVGRSHTFMGGPRR